jgi:hypothetical protein
VLALNSTFDDRKLLFPIPTLQSFFIKEMRERFRHHKGSKIYLQFRQYMRAIDLIERQVVGADDVELVTTLPLQQRTQLKEGLKFDDRVKDVLN